MDYLPWLRNILYGGDSGSGLQLHSQSSPGERNGKFGQNGKVHLGLNVSSSTHNCGGVVSGSNGMEQYEYYYFYYYYYYYYYYYLLSSSLLFYYFKYWVYQ